MIDGTISGDREVKVKLAGLPQSFRAEPRATLATLKAKGLA